MLSDADQFVHRLRTSGIPNLVTFAKHADELRDDPDLYIALVELARALVADSSSSPPVRAATSAIGGAS